MAYFSNSTDGAILDAQCGDCLIPDDWPCPVLMAQDYFNYEQCEPGLERLGDLLDMLVSEKGICQMKPMIDKLASTMGESYRRRELEKHGQVNFIG